MGFSENYHTQPKQKLCETYKRRSSVRVENTSAGRFWMLFEVRFLAPGMKEKKDVKEMKEMEKGRNEVGKMRPMSNFSNNLGKSSIGGVH